MKSFARVGVDLAKNYFQIHALSSEDKPAVSRKLTRSKMREFFGQIEPCQVEWRHAVPLTLGHVSSGQWVTRRCLFRPRTLSPT